MPRKIIQLVERDKVLFALCDDGSVWKLCKTEGRIGMSYGTKYEWSRLPNVPSDA